jgi:hypothetical protein
MAYGTCDHLACDKFNCSALNLRVVQNRPNRQGVGRDRSTNWMSVRVILSVSLIFFVPSSQPRVVSHELDTW